MLQRKNKLSEKANVGKKYPTKKSSDFLLQKIR
jgi:hypothetical protein